MKRAALIGMGDVFAVHYGVLRSMPAVGIAAVCDVSERRREAAPGVPFYTDYHALLSEVKPDVVHICLPHYLHYPAARAAAEAGCDVFCEKPLAVSAAQAEQFAALERAFPARRFGLCLQNRYNRSSAELARVIQSGTAGAVRGVRAMVPWARPKSYYEASPWRGKMSEAGGGVMLNQSVHTLDLMYCFAGEAARIRGSVSQTLDYGIEVEDTAVARIEFKSGAVGQFFATVACERNGSVEIEVCMEKETYIIRDCRLFRRTREGYEEIAEDERMPGSRFYYGAGHRDLIGRYYRCLETGAGGGYPRAADAVESIRMIDAIRESSRAGRTVEMDRYR